MLFEQVVEIIGLGFSSGDFEHVVREEQLRDLVKVSDEVVVTAFDPEFRQLRNDGRLFDVRAVRRVTDPLDHGIAGLLESLIQHVPDRGVDQGFDAFWGSEPNQGLDVVFDDRADGLVAVLAFDFDGELTFGTATEAGGQDGDHVTGVVRHDQVTNIVSISGEDIHQVVDDDGR